MLAKNGRSWELTSSGGSNGNPIGHHHHQNRQMRKIAPCSRCERRGAVSHSSHGDLELQFDLCGLDANTVKSVSASHSVGQLFPERLLSFGGPRQTRPTTLFPDPESWKRNRLACSSVEEHASGVPEYVYTSGISRPSRSFQKRMISVVPFCAKGLVFCKSGPRQFWLRCRSSNRRGDGILFLGQEPDLHRRYSEIMIAV